MSIFPEWKVRQAPLTHTGWTLKGLVILCQSSIRMGLAPSKTRQGQLTARPKAQRCFTLFLIKMKVGIIPALCNQKFTKQPIIILNINKEGDKSPLLALRGLCWPLDLFTPVSIYQPQLRLFITSPALPTLITLLYNKFIVHQHLFTLLYILYCYIIHILHISYFSAFIYRL